MGPNIGSGLGRLSNDRFKPALPISTPDCEVRLSTGVAGRLNEKFGMIL